MSTSIHNVYRVNLPKGTFWDEMFKIKKIAIQNVRKSLEKAHREVMSDVDITSPRYKELSGQGHDDNMCRLLIAHSIIRSGIQKFSNSDLRNSYDVDVSIVIYINKSRHYIGLYCDSVSMLRGCLDFVKDLDFVEDYHYQNSGDRPDNVSARDWSNRKKVWSSFMDDQGFINDQVVIEVCSPNIVWRYYPLNEMVQDHRSSKI